MFHENLKVFRKNKGMSQEQLAVRLHVVRQTISKWEKAELSDVADQLARLNDLVAIQIQNRQDFMKKAKTVVVIVLILVAFGSIYPKWNEIWYEFGQNLYYMLHK